MCVYKIEEIAEKVCPIAQQYGVGKIYLFGSCARGDATENSDVDLFIDAEKVHGFRFFGLYADLEEALQKKIDLSTEVQITQSRNNPLYQRFVEEIKSDRMVIYSGNDV